jgi:molybdopterin/thiamine biosynthesis adenylyltransferase
MPVLDMVCRDERITRVTLVEPDDYKPHNVYRHLFPAAAVGRPKGELARGWLRERRPDLDVRVLPCDLTDPLQQGAIGEAVEEADLGVCAADNEAAKYHFDQLMRRHARPWTLGEVLSGGIGGFVHRFVPGGPCYGCVASRLQRSAKVEAAPPAPDYSAPGGPVQETTVPASRAAIAAIASLHALLTLELIEPTADALGMSLTLLWSLQRVPGVFEEAFHPYRFRIARAAGCLICQAQPTPATAEDLDVALDQALSRLGDA